IACRDQRKVFYLEISTLPANRQNSPKWVFCAAFVTRRPSVFPLFPSLATHAILECSQIHPRRDCQVASVDVEIIAVGNGSTNETATILHRWANTSRYPP